MKKIDIASVEQLIKEVNELPNHFLYRGQADSSWPLKSSLERVIGNSWSAEKAQRFEDYALQQFRSKFHLYDHENSHPTSKLAWLSVMQHYGVPTRLLDFTESPYIALYFALESYTHHLGRDIALFALDYTAILQKSIEHIQAKDSGFKETRATVFERQDEIFDTVVDRFSYDIAWIAEPQVLNARLDRQGGSFLLSGNRSLQIESILALPLYADAQPKKFVIPASLVSGVFALLRKMNITSKSLYGDLEGLARSIRMQLQQYAV